MGHEKILVQGSSGILHGYPITANNVERARLRADAGILFAFFGMRYLFKISMQKDTGGRPTRLNNSKNDR